MDIARLTRHLRDMHSSPRPRAVRAFRGATTVSADQPALIREAVHEMLDAMLDDNDLVPADIISAVFTATPDLISEFPAHAARLYGWTDIPLICAQELPVVGALPRCLRVMIHAETTRPRNEIRHVYLRDAILLRSDLLAD
jgi:chorismate mutase